MHSAPFYAFRPYFSARCSILGFILVHAAAVFGTKFCYTMLCFGRHFGVRRFRCHFGARCFVLGIILLHGELFWVPFWCTVRPFRPYFVAWCLLGLHFAAQCAVLGVILLHGGPFWAPFLVHGVVLCLGFILVMLLRFGAGCAILGRILVHGVPFWNPFWRVCPLTSSLGFAFPRPRHVNLLRKYTSQNSQC